MSATNGDDLLVGDGNANNINGLGGDDEIYGRGGNDTLRGDSASGPQGNDLMKGEDGDDTLYGYGGHDELYGSDGEDQVHGGGGHDELYGGKQDDVLVGNSGDDRLAGNFGDDNLWGDSGADTFAFEKIGDINTYGDVVWDFLDGVDTFDVSGIDANAGLPGNQAFVFVGSGPFTGVGQIRAAEASGDTYVQVNTGGGAFPEGQFRIEGLHAIDASDFVL
jgi:Ca2+-binding RTX toxin-like protein